MRTLREWLVWAGLIAPPPLVLPVSIPGTHQEAARTLVDREAVSSARYVQSLVKQPWDASHPEIVKFGKRLIEDCRARGIPMRMAEGWRSGIRQEELFAGGFTKAHAGESPHNHGLAIDVIHHVRGWKLNEKEWAVIGAIGKEVARRMKLEIEWGGEWKFYDPAHWELNKWREMK